MVGLLRAYRAKRGFGRRFDPNPGEPSRRGLCAQWQQGFYNQWEPRESRHRYAVTDPSSGKNGISAFLVERQTSGYVVDKIEDKLGLNSSETAALRFENCRVPRENLLGHEGEGLRIALETLDGGRIGIAAQALGIAQACLEESLSYSQERKQFGEPIANFQAIQWMLADMATEIDAARLLTYRAAS